MARGSAATKPATGSKDSRPRLTVVEGKPYADLGEVEDFAKDLPDEYLLCRSLGHNWPPGGRVGRIRLEGTRKMGWVQELVCKRCGTARRMELDDRGMILSSGYTHPKGYLLEGLGRIVGDGRGALRLQSLKRVSKKARN